MEVVVLSGVLIPLYQNSEDKINIWHGSEADADHSLRCFKYLCGKEALSMYKFCTK